MAYYSAKLWGKKRVLNMEAFIAPANFDPASQPLNIVSVFGEYNNANKAYIYSFTSAIATLTLPASAGITYRWGETISGVDYVNDVVSGTAFTAGSTKRYVIVNSTATSLYANISSVDGFNGAIWIYCSSKIYAIFAQSNTYLNYVHCENLNSNTSIWINAFYGCKGLTGSLTIPDSVTTIETNAFSGCKGLTGTLTIPDSVTTIETNAFRGCTGLTGTLTIPDSVTIIENHAFNGCTGFTGSLTIPDSVTTIGTNPFYGTPFTHLISNSSYFEVYDEVLYTTTGTITAIYSAKGYSGTLTLKSNVVIIDNGCFYNNNLRTGSLTIPDTVTTIGTNAFYNCTGLTGSLTIPNSVTTIGDSAFSYCGKLNGIATIGSGITTIGYSGFYPIPLVTEWHILSLVAPSVQINTWGNYAKPLHVKIGATGYNVAPFTNTEIFSSIIYDL